jgi:hypothetical protein
MTKKQKKQRQNIKSRKFFCRNVIIGLGVAVAAVSIITYFGINSLIPVNGSSPVFAAPRNNFIKAVHSKQAGYVFVSQSAGGVKGLRGGGSSGNTNPTLTFNKGGLESIHLINEDYDTHSKHNLNIDEFNVHTKDLGYFGSQTITFIADKKGTFAYYCTIHPEMKGVVMVEAD